jgi:hypothetical protein
MVLLLLATPHERSFRNLELFAGGMQATHVLCVIVMMFNGFHLDKVRIHTKPPFAGSR